MLCLSRLFSAPTEIFPKWGQQSWWASVALCYRQQGHKAWIGTGASQRDVCVGGDSSHLPYLLRAVQLQWLLSGLQSFSPFSIFIPLPSLHCCHGTALKDHRPSLGLFSAYNPTKNHLRHLWGHLHGASQGVAVREAAVCFKQCCALGLFPHLACCIHAILLHRHPLVVSLGCSQNGIPAPWTRNCLLHLHTESSTGDASKGISWWLKGK